MHTVKVIIYIIPDTAQPMEKHYIFFAVFITHLTVSFVTAGNCISGFQATWNSVYSHMIYAYVAEAASQPAGIH